MNAETAGQTNERTFIQSLRYTLIKHRYAQNKGTEVARDATKVPQFLSIPLDPISDSIGALLGTRRLLGHVGLDVEVSKEDDEGDLGRDSIKS